MASLEERKAQAIRQYRELHEKVGRQQKLMLQVQRRLIKTLPGIARTIAIRMEEATTKRGLGQVKAARVREDKGIYEGLSRREAQTLNLALNGDSEKQIASKVKLSKHTVHLYITALYKHFHVHSRGELLARCLTRDQER